MPVNLKTLASRISALEARAQAGKRDNEELARRVALMRATVPPSVDAEIEAAAAAHELGGLFLPTEAEDPERPWKFHETQAAAFYSPARFRAIEAGRRSGKSWGRKVEIVCSALDPTWPLPDKHIVAGARTDQQTMRLFWRDLQRMIGKRYIREIRKSDREIETVTGAVIHVLGMDKPQRAEGFPIDDLYLDEYADMPPEAYHENLRASLSTRGRPAGRATLFGSTDMKSGEHFIKIADKWKELSEGDPDYAHFRWTSIGIVRDSDIEDARNEMPEAAFRVEFLAERVTTGNRAYYTFDKDTHCRPLIYEPNRPISLCLDFNVAPGVGVICQQQTWHDYSLSGERPEGMPDGLSETFTAVIGEIWIPNDSNTAAVVRKFIDLYGDHPAQICYYGDATGGSRGTAKLDGSDWDIVGRMLRKHYGANRVFDCVPSKNPPERKRVNIVLGALKNANGHVRALIDPKAAPMLVRDLERVTVLEGGSGELHKPSKGPNKDLSHISDAWGYYLVERIEREDAGPIVRPW